MLWPFRLLKNGQTSSYTNYNAINELQYHASEDSGRRIGHHSVEDSDIS
jgi:hypothetical protein